MSDKQNTETRVSAGERLKRLREEKNLSIAEMASRLYLHSRTIEALEQGDYNNLPAATYVRGYLQNYAKILDVPADSILALYENNTAEPTEIIPEVEPEPKPTHTDKPAATFLYFGVFVSILLLFTWWRSPFVPEPDTPAETADIDSRGSAGAPPGLSYPITVVEHPKAPFYRATIAEQAAETDDAMKVTSSGYDENIITKGNGPDSIRMVITADSWIEVFDANNEKVYYDLSHAGQTLLLNGTAPFSVLLGFAAGVTIELNGVAFDPVPRSSRIGIARFTLGE